MSRREDLAKEMGFEAKRLEQRVDADRAGEPFRRSLPGWLRTVSLNLSVCVSKKVHCFNKSVSSLIRARRRLLSPGVVSLHE